MALSSEANFLSSGAHDDLLVEVFTFLELRFVDHIAAVSTRFRRVSHDDSWKPELLLFSWGSALASGHEIANSKPCLLQKFYSPHATMQIRSVACSDFFTLLLTREGEVWRFGDFGVEEIKRPQRVDSLRNISKVAVTAPGYYHHRGTSARFHLAALSRTGTLWQWGHNYIGGMFLELPENTHNDSHDTYLERLRQVNRIQGPEQSKEYERRSCAYHPRPVRVSRFDDLAQNIVDVSCGIMQSVVTTIDEAGLSRVWEARLGRCREVCKLRGVALRQLVCGGFFNAAIDKELNLWTWGCRRGWDLSNGNLLGRGRRIPMHNHSPYMEPKMVQVAGHKGNVDLVVCSSYTAAVLTTSGEAFTWGDSDGGALGHGASACNEPTQIVLPSGSDERVTNISLSYTNGSLVSESGRVIMWGGSAWGNTVTKPIAATDDASYLHIMDGDENYVEVRPSAPPSQLRELDWVGLSRGYRAKGLFLGHGHALLMVEKIAA